ncbi:MAG: DUF6715 family protein [Lachnospiraceae bacterium]
MAATAKPLAKKNNNNGSAIKAAIIIIILIGLVVGYYYYLNNKTKQRVESQDKLTVTQELLTRNLTYNYPPTPKEVVRFYSEITKCFYNESYTNEELEQLAEKIRELYDEELLEKNDWNQYLVDLNREIQTYKEKNIRVINYSLSSSTDVDFYNVGEKEVARLYCTFVLQSGSTKQNVEEVFILRKDEDGHWKILGWDHADKVKEEE